MACGEGTPITLHTNLRHKATLLFKDSSKPQARLGLGSAFPRYLPLVYSLLLLAVMISAHFAILNNDSFPLRWQAEHLSLNHPDTFYNGFFPIGYPLLLKTMSILSRDPLLPGIILHIILSACFVSILWKFFRCWLSDRFTLVTIAIALVNPLLLKSELNAVPDFLATLFVLWAITLIVMKEQYLQAGLLLGAGYLFRTHTIALTIALIVMSFISHPRSFKQYGSLLLGLLPFLMIQGVIQVWAGHGFFENAQYFNIWKTMNGVDWSHPSTQLSPSIGYVISQQPDLFLQTILSELWDVWPSLLSLLIPLTYGIIKRVIPKKLLYLALASVLYLILIAPGGSPRGILLVLPVCFACGSWFFESIGHSIIHRIPHIGFILVAMVILAVASGFMFAGADKAARRIHRYSQIAVVCDLHNLEDVNRVVTDDFALYFPGAENAQPAVIGGWAMIGLPNYAKQAPVVNESSGDSTFMSLRQRRAKWLIIRNPPFDSPLLDIANSDTNHFKRLNTPTISSHFIFRINDAKLPDTTGR